MSERTDERLVSRVVEMLAKWRQSDASYDQCAREIIETVQGGASAPPRHPERFRPEVNLGTGD